MRVDPLGTPPPLKQTTAGTAPKAARSPESPSPNAVSDAGSFTPTSELTALLTAVKQAPDVRPEVVESVAARLASGELDTPEAAADTARSLLSDPPEPPAQ
jgi:hypothetical protein